MTKKYFHIRDALALVAGRPLSRMEAATAPDGTAQPARRTPMDGVIDLVEFITGVDCGHPANPLQYDHDSLMAAVPFAEDVLRAQFPALYKKPLPEDRLGAAGKRRQMALLEEWMAAIAKKCDTEWLAVEALPPERQQFIRKFLTPVFAPPVPAGATLH